MQLLFLLLFLPLASLLAEDPVTTEIPRLAAEAEPSLTVEGCVNVVSGSFFQSNQDVEIGGPAPLSWNRIYEATEGVTTELGYGEGCSIPYFMHKRGRNKKGQIVFEVESRRGASRHFFAGKDKSKLYQGRVDPKVYQSGYTNFGRGGGHVKNSRLEFSKFNKFFMDGEAVVTEGNGLKRIYRPYSKLGGIREAFQLEKEILPNGNLVFYDYNDSDKTIHVRSMDSDEQSTLAELKVDWGGDCVTIEGSNGQWAHYHRSKKEIKKGRVGGTRYAPFYSYFTDSSENDRGDKTSTEWTRLKVVDHAGHKTKLPLPTKLYKDGSHLELSYYENSSRVKEISQPLGVGNASVVTHRFEYFPEFTDHFDPSGTKTRYRLTKDSRISSIERYLGKGVNEGLLSVRRYLWDEQGQLTMSSLENARASLLNSQTFVYDKRGNVLKKILVGSLSGTCDHQESFATTNTYSEDGFNLLLSQQEDFGPRIVYEYKPGTNLMVGKYTCDGPKIVLRELFHYNSNATVYAHYKDDGSSKDPTSLAGVTERHIRRFEYNKQCFPVQISTLYLDLETGEEKLLQRETLSYTYGDLVATRSLYDSCDELQYTIHYEYDERRRLIVECDALGRVSRYQYDDNNRLTQKERVGSGFQTKLTYDVGGRLIRTEEMYDDGQIRTATKNYNPLGNLLKSTDPFGHTTRYIYDTAGRQTGVSYPPQGGMGRTSEQRTLNLLDQPVTITDPSGGTSHLTYNSRGQQTRKIFPDGSKERIRYNLNGTVHTKVHRDKTKTIYSYDLLQRPTAMEVFKLDDTFLKGTYHEYDSLHLRKTIDANGVVTEFEYDGAGRKILERKAGRETHFGYDTMGRECSVMEGGLGTLKTFDVAGRVIEICSVSDASDIFSKEESIYDDCNRVIEKRVWSSDHEASVTQSLYDSRGKLVLLIDPEGRETHYCYDYDHLNKHGQRVLKSSSTDSLGNQLVEVHNSNGKVALKQRFNSFGERTEKVETLYDASGKIVKQINHRLFRGESRGVYEVEWERDQMGRVLSLVEGSKVTRYQYDLAGRVIATTKPDGQVLYKSYDPLGRLATYRSSDGTIHYIYTYDLKDNLLEITNQIDGSSTIRKYDEWDSLVHEQMANGLASDYQRDAMGRLSRIILPDDSLIDYRYDGPFVTEIMRKGQTHSFDQYDWQGRPTQQTLMGNAGQRATQYDLAGRPSSIKTPQLDYTIDALDNGGRITQISIDGQTHNFSYDGRNQLQTESGLSDHTYENDSLHSRQSKDGAAHEVNDLNQLESDGHNNYRYDANGNLLSDSQNIYTYDALNRLVSVTQGDIETTYTYDSFGRRLSKQQAEEAEQYFYYRDEEIGSYQDDAIIELRLPGPHHSVAFELHGQTYIPLYDHRGSILSLVSRDGEIAANYRYSAFGEQEEANTLSPWRYQGKRFDGESSLHYFGKRYYQPSTGRFLTPDPLDFADGPNLYAYVKNQTLDSVDPTGLFQSSTFASSASSSWLGSTASFRPGTQYHSRPTTWTNHRKTSFFRFDIGSNPNSRIQAISMNGWNCRASDALKMLDDASRGLGGCNSGAVYNPCYSHFSKLKHTPRALFLKTRTPQSRRLQFEIEKMVRENPNKVTYVTLHSDGTIQGGLALAALSDFTAKRIHVRTYGGLLVTDTKRYASVMNYVARGDLVPRLLNKDVRDGVRRPYITYLGDPNEAWGSAHGFFNKTYRHARKRDHAEFFEHYGQL